MKIKNFYNFLNEIKPVNLISHNNSYFFKNNLYKSLYKKNNSLTNINNKNNNNKNNYNKNNIIEPEFESHKLITTDIKNIFNLNLNFYENEKYNKINIENKTNNIENNIENNNENNNDYKYKTLKEFLHEKIEIHKKRLLYYKINENARHSPGQYNPNYNYLYKKIRSPIFNKTLKRKSIFDSSDSSLNKFNNKSNKNYSIDEENEIINEKKKRNKNNIIKLKKKFTNLSFCNNNNELLNINKKIENSRNVKNNKRNNFLNDSTKDTKEIINKNKSVDDLINFKEKELTLKEKVKIFLITSKKYEKEQNKFLILNPLYNNSPRKFNISFSRMLGRDSNIFKDRYNNLNKYNPNFSMIFPRVQSAIFGENIKTKKKEIKKININIIKK